MDNAHKQIVMVVEDEELLLSAIEKKLATHGYQVMRCLTGEDALEKLSQLEHMPDIIWLDYYLGGMNANGFVTKLKQNDKTAHIPIIIVSNSASEQKKKEMVELGVKRYILKAQYKLDDIIAFLEEEMNTAHE